MKYMDLLSILSTWTDDMLDHRVKVSVDVAHSNGDPDHPECDCVILDPRDYVIRGIG